MAHPSRAGLHEGIIDDAIWKRVETQQADHGGKTIRSTRRPTKRLLDGVLFDSKGRAIRSTYASKLIRADGTIRTKPYWYYTSSLSGSEDKSEIERLPADQIERVVLEALNERLADKRWLADQIKGQAREAIVGGILRTIEQQVVGVDMTTGDAQPQDFQNIIDRIDAHKDRLVISVDLAALA